MAGDGGRIGVHFEVDGRRNFNDFARALGKANRQIPKRVDAIIKKGAKELAKEAAAKVLTEPSLQGKSTGLRRKIAKGVGTIPVDNGIRQGHRVITKMPSEEEKFLPRGFDGDRGFAHPVFSRPDRETKWVRQRLPFSWFMDTMQDARPRLTPRIHDMLEDVADEIKNEVRGG
jgi:hypothetical protein